MPNYRDLNYDDFLERTIFGDTAPMGDSVSASTSVLSTSGMTPSEISNALPANALPPTTVVSTRVTGENLLSSNFVTGVSGYAIYGNGDVEFNNGTFRGALTAATIDIGGTDVTSFHVDIDGNMWLGAGTFSLSSNPFAVSNAGSLRARSGLIANFTIITDYLYSLASGTPTVAPNDGLFLRATNPAMVVYEDTEKRIELGYLSAGVFGIKGYATDGTTVTFELSDTQQKIAGWNFTDTVFRSGATDVDSNVLIDSANSLIRLGPTSGSYVTIDGANQRIRTSNYVSGFAGAGLTLEPDLLEVGNIACRGLFRTYVLQKDILSVNAGSLIIAPNADVLDTDMTALDASTMTIKGTVTFAVNDRLRIKDGTDDEWFLVTNIASAPTYTVTRDQAAAYAVDANPQWKKGASVVNYGQSGAGGLYLTASDTNNPYLSVFTHAGSPWSTITTQLRLGNLNGYLGYVADIFGLGVGSSAGTDANITIEPTNGIRLRKGTTNSVTLDNSGNLTLGEVGAGLANTYISAGALSLRLNTTAYFNVDTSGNVLVGRTGASQSNVYVTSGALKLRNNITDKIVLAADGTAYFAGAVTIGDGATTSGTITLNHFNTGGDTYISGGTITAAAWTAQNGFLFGIDDSDSDKVKLYIGDSATGQQLDWNVTTLNKLTINGKLNGLDSFGGDGSDGALSVGAGVTTTLNLDQVYNYSSISVNATGTLTFTGSGGGYINCSGNCTIAGTVELRNMITAETSGGTIRDNLQGGTPAATPTLSAGGAGGAGVSGGQSGGAGGTSTTASGTPGVGGAGGTVNNPGTAGSGGNSSVGGGGGGGGGGSGTPGSAGSTTVNNNGGAGGNGGDGAAGSAAGGGGGGGGYDTGNGGAGGNGGNVGAASVGCVGAPGGASGANGGNGGNGGNGTNGSGNTGGAGGAGGDGYTNGGNGGTGGLPGSSYGGAGGAAGIGVHGTGGTGGTGGDGNGGGTAGGGDGGAGGAGRTGGAGGAGGAQGGGTVRGGNGGTGGAGKAGSTFFALYVAGTMDVTGMTVNAQGGDGGAGGTGGASATGGNGGDGGDGADIVMVSLGAKTGTPTVNNLGGTGGNAGTGGTSSGNAGSDGTDGVQIVAQIKQIL